MYPHNLNPDNVSEGGHSLSSQWGYQFNSARAAGTIHRTIAVATYCPRPNLKWPPRDGIQRNPKSAKPILPRVTYQYLGPVLLGPADNNLY